MVERTESGPRALLDLVRRETAGEASPRRHQASRARLLTAYEDKPRGRRWLPLAAVGTLVFGGVAFEGVQLARRELKVNGVPTIAMQPEAADSGQGFDIEKVTLEGASITMGAEEDPAPAIVIRVEPASAEITWDGKPLEGNPAAVRNKLDGKPHEVTAMLAGYVPVHQTVVANGPSLVVSLELTPTPLALGPLTSSPPLARDDDSTTTLRPRIRECLQKAIDHGFVVGSTTLLVETDGYIVQSARTVDVEGLPAIVTTCLAHVASDTYFATLTKAATIRIPIRVGKP